MQNPTLKNNGSKKLMTSALVLILVFIMTACQLPEGVNVPQSPLLAALERKSGLIAYVGVDGNIYTMDQAGGNIVAFTDDAEAISDSNSLLRLYQLPAWSPNSEKLAFFKTELNAADSSFKTTVLTSSVSAEPEVTELYSTTTEIPVYSYWAPDNDQLSFISFNQKVSTMLFNIVDQAGQHQIADAGRPYYWNWAPDSQRLIIHAGSSVSPTPERMSFLNVGEDNLVLESLLEEEPGFYQAPAWSPNGEWLLLAITKGERQTLVLADRFGEIEQTLLNFDETIGFSFSPDGSKVAAVVGGPVGNGLLVGRLHVFDLETPEEVFISEEENVMSFFWAPNSDDIAYFPIEFVDLATGQEGEDPSLQEQQPVVLVNLQAYTHSTGETRELMTNFLPTEHFFSVLSAFDQYQHSATIWSPDSQNIVITAQTPEAPFLLIVSATGGFEPRAVTNGMLAFWSWD